MKTTTTSKAPAPAPAPAPKAIALTVNNVKKAIKDNNSEVIANLLTRANKMATPDDKAKTLKIELLTLLVDAQKASTPAPKATPATPQKASKPEPEKALEKATPEPKKALTNRKEATAGQTVTFIADNVQAVIIGGYTDANTGKDYIVVVDNASKGHFVTSLTLTEDMGSGIARYESAPNSYGKTDNHILKR